MKQMTYSQVGDYQMPNLQTEQKPLNSHFARLRYQYLKENHQGHLFSLRANNQLNQHLIGDRGTGTGKNGNIDESIISETPSTKQGKISDGMGTTHELVEDDGRGNHSQGDHLQLDLELNINDEVVKKKRLCHLLI